MPDIVTLTVPMTYEGGVLSKNRLWHGGNRRAGMNKEAKAWKKALADFIQYAFLEQRVIGRPALPVEVRIAGTFYDRNHAVDMHNLAEIVCDAVQDGLGLNDRDFTTITERPQFSRKGIPQIVVTVTFSIQT